MPKIISAFPGTGKSWLFNNQEDNLIIDSDSSNYSWDADGNRNKDFPKNYIEHITNLNNELSDNALIMVSTHKEVREGLEKENLKHFVVYPNVDLKDDYIERFKERGNDDKFIEMMGKNWDNFINDIKNSKPHKLIELQKGEYLSDVLADIYT